MQLPCARRVTNILTLAFALPTTIAQTTPERVRFDLTDDPGQWFRSAAGPVAGTHSLAVTHPGAEVSFSGASHTVHTMTSLLFPTGAAGMPFDTRSMKGSASLVLATPGLYVFVCKIHPYMLGAVIVDDPATAGLDLGENLTLLTGLRVPSRSDLATRLLRTFFIATNPANWQDFRSSAPWHVTYPDVNVRITGGAVVNLRSVLNQRYGNDTPLPALRNPITAGVGDVGSHGVQFGAKKGGGYYAYVTNKFANSMIVVDPDPNNDGNPADAEIAGRVLMAASPSTARDDVITGNVGMGGQGVLPIPVVYNGWVQKLPQVWKDQLTPQQRNPIP